MNLNQDIVNLIKGLINSPKKIVIITHANPDGDAIGASLAFYGIFIQQNHYVSVITPNEFPSFLAWMPFSNKILIHKFESQKVSKAINEADIIFCLDFNDVKRMEKI